MNKTNTWFPQPLHDRIKLEDQIDALFEAYFRHRRGLQESALIGAAVAAVLLLAPSRGAVSLMDQLGLDIVLLLLAAFSAAGGAFGAWLWYKCAEERAGEVRQTLLRMLEEEPRAAILVCRIRTLDARRKYRRFAERLCRDFNEA